MKYLQKCMPVMHKTLEFEIAFAVEDRSDDLAITKLTKQNEQFTHCFISISHSQSLLSPE